MSYDVYFEIDTGADEPTEVDWRNYTSNASPMWTKALKATGFWDDTLGNLIDQHPQPEVLGPIVKRAAEYMRANPDEFAPMNPPNGWGDYEGALDYLEWLASGCATFAKCTVRVSR